LGEGLRGSSRSEAKSERSHGVSRRCLDVGE
jgi:hypothetical protein